ncbi:TadE/TadG family type IV pilus assembly protein [Eggerthella sp. YY7918]|uniref:TadE/TadG family type IV pilus assembly protein n=1 Tax=Eggerthella sp. (strain YY7918) TaxID=502558 RepID=UPI0002171383|nr:TadE/TadG family type IV pilus assembly protein [Eggerthella sp. YY7918]BAK45336.1 hypothetical protein EGYY_22620 [Eggerthella sp. YY7918]
MMCAKKGLQRLSRPLWGPMRDERAQGTVEAAFLIPLLFVGLLLLIQPGVLLYDRLVMTSAASEACRLLATKTDALGDMTESCEAFVRHRLGAVPPVSCFHLHEGACSWDIRFEGDENTNIVRVTITNEARPLPLIGAGGALLGIVNDAGNFTIEVSVEGQTQPAWVETVEAGRNPSGWVGAWSS